MRFIIRIFLIIIILTYFMSCIKSSKVNVDDFKMGSFKTVLDDRETVSMAYRNDSVQIESYNEVKDTFYITWLDQFEYVMLKKNTETLLDSTPFHVKITSIKNDSYTFRAHYKGSNFKQKGTAFKLD